VAGDGPDPEQTVGIRPFWPGVGRDPTVLAGTTTLLDYWSDPFVARRVF
jgi:hypothetical protein